MGRVMNPYGEDGVRDDQGMQLPHSGHLDKADVGETKVEM